MKNLNRLTFEQLKTIQNHFAKKYPAKNIYVSESNGYGSQKYIVVEQLLKSKCKELHCFRILSDFNLDKFLATH